VKFFRLSIVLIVLAVGCHARATIVRPNEALMPYQSLESNNRRYLLAMQGDGNLVYYRVPEMLVRFQTATVANPGAWTLMQGDGNLVTYRADQRPLWSSQTHGNPGAYLSLQDDGNLVVYANGRPLWNIGVDATDDNPSIAGDAIGRSLDVAGLGALGHRTH
jgi:hypothetical protein